VQPAHRWVWVRDGRSKTELLRERIFEGALDPAVRDTAVRLTQMVDRNHHRERVRRLHAFVRDAVQYHNEPAEMFQSAPWTLEHGGDCDCLTILLGSLAWSLRFPWLEQSHGDPLDPEHYSIWLGFPPSDSPTGDAHTIWTHAEPSAAAAFGETSQEAAHRRAVL